MGVDRRELPHSNSATDLLRRVVMMFEPVRHRRPSRRPLALELEQMIKILSEYDRHVNVFKCIL